MAENHWDAVKGKPGGENTGDYRPAVVCKEGKDGILYISCIVLVAPIVRDSPKKGATHP